ncbi:uncharacterized protein LOC126896048 [Daktulosphaira vitifoliae]|uniref:uncharacterized protein LOC126896048 n=1 Tax=Daktulosphaira vitifoliae TaxID=58002 RepID=UPI0021A9E950|nr:uncharacterized protein LOC126896048 [Daktulosphaira vitifoliae]
MKKHALLAEHYKKEKLFQNVYTTFRPNLKVSPITGKFYAYHEATINKGNPHEHYLQLLALAKLLGPKNKYDSPKTENQKYGWFETTFTPRNKNILLFPRVETPEIKLEIILKKNLKK